MESLYTLRFPLLFVISVGLLTGFSGEAVAVCFLSVVLAEMVRGKAEKHDAVTADNLNKFASMQKAKESVDAAAPAQPTTTRSLASSKALSASSDELSSVDISSESSISDDELPDAPVLKKAPVKTPITRAQFNPKPTTVIKDPIQPPEQSDNDAHARLGFRFQRTTTASFRPRYKPAANIAEVLDTCFDKKALQSNIFLLSQVQQMEDGFYAIPVSIIANFRRVRELNLDQVQILKAADQNDNLVVCGGTFIRRKDGYLPTSCVKASNIPSTCSREDIYNNFVLSGRIRNIHVHDTGNKRTAVVRFHSCEEAEAAVSSNPSGPFKCMLHRGTTQRRRPRPANQAGRYISQASAFQPGQASVLGAPVQHETLHKPIQA